jgi:UDPglucose 6-dehydrogenase
MIKYAANAFLAAKISFANEMANVCERVGTDFADVAKGIGLDHRIGPHFLAAGIGYGGSCFPKDVKAIIELSKKKGYAPAILEAAAQVNRGQPKHALAVLKKKLGALKGKKIAVVGIAFKPGTDDIREAPAITIIDELLKAGAVVSACDPAAVKNAKKVFGGKVEFSEKLTDCIKGADAAVIATEWPEYRTGPEVFKKLMRGNIIIDGRRVLDPAASKSAGLEYFGIGYGK